MIYIFYNYEGKSIQQEAAKLLYSKDWIYNVEEYLWFYKVNFSDVSNIQFFNIKKWELQQYQYDLRREQFAKVDDFDTYYKISENGNTSNSP